MEKGTRPVTGPYACVKGEECVGTLESSMFFTCEKGGIAGFILSFLDRIFLFLWQNTYTI